MRAVLLRCRGALRYRRTSAVGTGIDDHSIAQLAQLVSEKSGGGTAEQLGGGIQLKQEAQRMVLTAPPQVQLEINPLASDLNQLSQLVQPSPPPPTGLPGMPFELLPGTSQPSAVPTPAAKRPRTSLGYTAQGQCGPPNVVQGPPKSPRQRQWGATPPPRRGSGGGQQAPVGELGLPVAAGPPPPAVGGAEETGSHVVVAGIASLREVQRQLAWEEGWLLCGLLLDVCSPAQAGVLLTQGFPYTTDLALLLQLLNQEHKRDVRD